MSKQRTGYDHFLSTSVKHRRLLRQEELILEATEALWKSLEQEGITQTQLAERLGKTKGYVSQILAGGRNLTLRTLADTADAIGFRVGIDIYRDLVFNQEPMVTYRLENSQMPGWPSQVSPKTSRTSEVLAA